MYCEVLGFRTSRGSPIIITDELKEDNTKKENQMDAATIRKVTGGYIVTVRWPLAGTPLGGGEMVCTSFDEAVTVLHKHFEVLEEDVLERGDTRPGGPKGTTPPSPRS